jgi:hypothetical protein
MRLLHAESTSARSTLRVDRVTANTARRTMSPGQSVVTRVRCSAASGGGLTSAG